MKTHKLLDGTTLNLRGLSIREQAFLRDLKKMGREEVSYFEIYRTAVGPGSPALEGRNRIDSRVASSPLYLAARDIATRAGVEQGLVLAPKHAEERAAAKAAAKERPMISVAQTARLIGMSRAAVYKAIGKGNLEAERVGNVTVVSRKSALDYRKRSDERAAKRAVKKTAAAPAKQATGYA